MCETEPTAIWGSSEIAEATTRSSARTKRTATASSLHHRCSPHNWGWVEETTRHYAAGESGATVRRLRGERRRGAGAGDFNTADGIGFASGGAPGASLGPGLADGGSAVHSACGPGFVVGEAVSGFAGASRGPLLAAVFGRVVCERLRARERVRASDGRKRRAAGASHEPRWRSPFKRPATRSMPAARRSNSSSGDTRWMRCHNGSGSAVSASSCGCGCAFASSPGVAAAVAVGPDGFGRDTAIRIGGLLRGGCCHSGALVLGRTGVALAMASSCMRWWRTASRSAARRDTCAAAATA